MCYERKASSATTDNDYAEKWPRDPRARSAVLRSVFMCSRSGWLAVRGSGNLYSVRPLSEIWARASRSYDSSCRTHPLATTVWGAFCIIAVTCLASALLWPGDTESFATAAIFSGVSGFFISAMNVLATRRRLTPPGK